VSRPVRSLLCALAVLVVIGLGLALGIGAPDPGLAERAAAVALGGLGLLAGIVVIASLSTGHAALPGVATPDSEEPVDAGEATLAELERSLRFGASSAGDFYALVRPRLVALSAARLRTHRVTLEDRDAAPAMLGPDVYALVDPAQERPGERFAPGVSLEEVRRVVERLEALGGAG